MVYLSVDFILFQRIRASLCWGCSRNLQVLSHHLVVRWAMAAERLWQPSTSTGGLHGCLQIEQIAVSLVVFLKTVIPTWGYSRSIVDGVGWAVLVSI